ncbi:MAG: succinate dehydrogenase/fumarate reductase iron-sulfur subunit [Candidatus Micrarchaeota archaeon]|nr:succinate dehydrogenase/fumarate reductase iron-sulfur subunit [Candidatus Micrarchaeota archaeon]
MRENTKHIPGKGRIITVRIKRFNSTTKNFETETYRAKADELQTVLGALLDIKAYSDPTLSMRYSCRMGICGSCGMEVNGKPVLACETNLLSSLDTNGEIEVQPMHGHPLLKDLVTDFDSFFEKHKSVGANLYRKDEKEQYEAKRIYKQTSGQTEKFLPYSFCIMCGLCLDACPVVNSNPNFVGPQALSQVYRYNADSRDQGAANRLVGIDSIDGVWGCEFAGSCSKVCPKGVDPASAIQLLKGDAMKGFFEKGDVDEE